MSRETSQIPIIGAWPKICCLRILADFATVLRASGININHPNLMVAMAMCQADIFFGEINVSLLLAVWFTDSLAFNQRSIPAGCEIPLLKIVGYIRP